MTIPDFQSLMMPLLEISGDGKEHKISESADILAIQFGLSDNERKVLLPSGRQARFDNRVHWARTYLVKACLLNSTGRGKFCITERGLDVLQSNPDQIDVRFLEQFPELIAFTKLKHNSSPVMVENTDSEDNQTPEEVLESSYQNLRQELSRELLEKVKECSPKFFEKLVVDLLLSMGYGGTKRDAGEAIGRSGDGGIDGIIKEDKLGLDAIYIQAKRWEGTVGRPVVQAFAGSLEGQRARKGIMITTSQFSKEARDYVKVIEKKIVLIDGEELAQLMIDYDIGVSEVAKYVVKKCDLDYFGEE